MTTFKHDPNTGAWSVRLRDGEFYDHVRLGDPDSGASVRVDWFGNVLAVEFTSFEAFTEMLARTGNELPVPLRIPPKLFRSDW